MSESGPGLHEEVSGACSSSLQNLHSIVTKFVRLFDGCETLVQSGAPIAPPGGRGAEQGDRVWVRNNVVPFGRGSKRQRS